MIKYFRELLATLKSIDNKLASIEKNTDRLTRCTYETREGYVLRTKESIERY